VDNVHVVFSQEPDEQEAPDDQDSSPPEDTSLYPPGTMQLQQVACHGSRSPPWWPALALQVLSGCFSIEFIFRSPVSQITSSPSEGCSVCTHTTPLTFDLNTPVGSLGLLCLLLAWRHQADALDVVGPSPRRFILVS